MSPCIILRCTFFQLGRFVTVARTRPSGASSSKRKAPENAWLEHVDIDVSMGRHGMSVNCVHCKMVFESTIRLNYKTYSDYMSLTRP